MGKTQYLFTSGPDIHVRLKNRAVLLPKLLMPSENCWTVSSQDVMYAVFGTGNGSKISYCTEM